MQTGENILKLTEIEKKLKNYILSNYDMNEKDISLKFVHTFNTKLVSDEIAKSLELCERDFYLSSIIALFHDYARFEQARLFHSFNDLKTFDHGDFAVKKLFDENEIFNFVDDLSNEELEIVKIAIKNHNKFYIEDGLSERQQLFCKIIRDADKVDIFRILSSDPRIKGVKQGNLIEKDLKCFLQHEAFKKTKDYDVYKCVLLHLCLIFDLNFTQSFIILNRNKYLNKFNGSLKSEVNFKLDERLDDCFEESYRYIESMTKKGIKC